MSDRTPEQRHRATALDAAGFTGPFCVDHVAAGLITDRVGRSLALALPVFADPDVRAWFTAETVAALNERFGFRPEAVSDPLDPEHLRAVAAESQHFRARTSRPPAPLDLGAEAQAARRPAAE